MVVDQNLSTALQAVLDGGAVTSKSLNYFDANSANPLPRNGEKGIITEVYFQRNDSGTTSVLYRLKEPVGGHSYITKSNLFGKHFTEKPGDFAMADIQCRTRVVGNLSDMGEVVYAEFTENGKKQRVKVWKPTREITVTFGKAPNKVYIADGNNAWGKNKPGHMAMFKETTDYPVMTLS